MALSSRPASVRLSTHQQHTLTLSRACIRQHAYHHRPIAAARAAAAEAVVQVTATSPSGTSTQFNVDSGAEVLRSALMAEKVDLYDMWGKVMNCGGGGSCGTCVVQVLEGAELLSETTTAEDKKLKSKPATWRLACQTIVGDGKNAGKVSVRTQPKA